MRQPSRRTFLGAAAGLVGVAGCLDRNAPSGEPAGGSPSATTARTSAAEPVRVGTSQPVGDATVTVSNLTVQDAVLYLDSPDSMAVATREDERYVLVSVATASESESAPPASAVDLRLDDTSADVADLRGGLDGRVARYDPSNGVDEGYLPFLVPPALDVETARIVVEHDGDRAAWELDETAVDALRRPKARFEFEAVDLPETIRADEPVTTRVAATNVSDVAGVFRGVLNVSGLGAAYVPYAFVREAAPGETVVWEKEFDDRPPESAEAVGFYLKTVAGERSVEAAVESGGAEDTTETPTPASDDA